MINILVADDEDILRRNLTFILGNTGYPTFAARNTLEATDILKRHSIDIVITDLVMPERGGGELINYIAENHPGIHVFIMTAYPTLDSAIDAVRMGVIEYFTKPFRTEDILAAVKRVEARTKGNRFKWTRLQEFGVTDREESVLRAIIEDGLGENKEIAGKLNIKPSTVKQHIDNLFGRFEVGNRAALIARVMQELIK